MPLSAASRNVGIHTGSVSNVLWSVTWSVIEGITETGGVQEQGAEWNVWT
jgi:hypothetical protein